MKAFLYLALAMVSLGALSIMVKSYLDERSDTLRNPPTDLSRHPERTGIANLREVSFVSAGGVTLAAWYAPPGAGRAAVVLVHGVGAERSSLLVETGFLADAGLGVLALDLPGQGASGGKSYWGVPERQAISAAVGWLASEPEVDPQRIGGFGLSMGAYVLAQAAVLDPRLRAVALVSTPNAVVEFNWLATRRWGWLSQVPCYLALRAAGTPLDLTPKDILGEIAPRPVLIVGGGEDPLVPSWMAEQLYAAARMPKALYIVPHAHHADFAKVAPREYAARLQDFFSQALEHQGPGSLGLSGSTSMSAADGGAATRTRAPD